MIVQINDKIKKEHKQLQLEVRERMTGYILGGLGLVAGLAWNEAIKAAIDYLFPLNKDGLAAKFLYAVIITLVVALAVYIITKFFVKKEEETLEK
ncbi:MAG: DUF5654 family protein [bacterium]|nr:DUF5654 family protein [bacterium]